MDVGTSYLTKESIEEISVRVGMVTAEQMQNALQIAQNSGKSIEQVLIEERLLTAYDLAAALSIPVSFAP